MEFLTVTCVFLILCAKWIDGKELPVEPIETTWRYANFICESSNFILMPGRSYRKADLVRALTLGQTVWLNGWRMVTENQPDANGNIRFLKTDFIPSYNVMIRKYICEYDDGTFNVNEVPARSSTDQKKAATYCEESGGHLATISRQDVKTILDLVQDKVPHWSNRITSSDSIAKQCLAVMRISSGIKYYYEDCDRNLPFVCLQDETASVIFAPIVSKRYAPFKDFETVIARLASRTTIRTTVEDTTQTTQMTTTKELDESTTTKKITKVMKTTTLDDTTAATQTTTKHVADTTTSEETTFDAGDTSTDDDQVTNAETNDILTRSSTTPETAKSTNEESGHYSLLDSTHSSAEYQMTTPVPRNETSSNNQISENVSFSESTQTSKMSNTTNSPAYKQDTIKPSPVIGPGTIQTLQTASSDIDESSIKPSWSFNRSYETSFSSATPALSTLSSSSKNLQFTSLSYPASNIIELPVNSTSKRTVEMDSSTIIPSVELIDKSHMSVLVPFETASKPLVSSSSVSINSGIKPSVMSFSFSQFQNTQSLYPSLKTDSFRSSAMWESTRNVSLETATRIFETTREEDSRFIENSQVFSDSKFKTNFSTPIFTDSVRASHGQPNTQTTLSTSSVTIEVSPSVDLSQRHTATTTNTWSGTYVMKSVTRRPQLTSSVNNLLTTSFTSHSNSIIRPSWTSQNTRMATEILQSSEYSSSDSSDSVDIDSYDQDYYHDYQSTVALSTEHLNSILMHSKPATKSTPAIDISRSISRNINSTLLDSSPVTHTISPTKTTDVIMSDDLKIQKVDINSINRSSRQNPRRGDASPMWIAIGVIGIATVISLLIAVILYKRRRKQKKITEIHTNGTQHPLVNKQQKDTIGASKPHGDFKDKQKNTDQSCDVFVDEAYDL